MAAAWACRAWAAGAAAAAAPASRAWAAGVWLAGAWLAGAWRIDAWNAAAWAGGTSGSGDAATGVVAASGSSAVRDGACWAVAATEAAAASARRACTACPALLRLCMVASSGLDPVGLDGSEGSEAVLSGWGCTGSWSQLCSTACAHSQEALGLGATSPSPPPHKGLPSRQPLWKCFNNNP